MRSWYNWAKVNFQMIDKYTKIQEYRIWRNTHFHHECELILWFLTSNYNTPFNEGVNKGSNAVFIVLNRENPNNFKQINEGLDLFIKDEKGFIPIISLLSCTYKIDEEKNDSPITSDSEINQFIDEISSKYQTYVPYFDLDNLKSINDPMKICSELIFLKNYMRIKIRDQSSLDMINYAYQQKKDPNYLNQLKNYIENSPDEGVLFFIIDSLSKNLNSQNYFRNLPKINSDWCQLLVDLILKNVNWQDLNKHLNNTNNKFYLETFIQRIYNIDVLKDIVINNQFTKFRLMAFKKVSKTKDEEFFKKIIWTSQDTELISKAAFLITDQDELKKIIFGKLDWNVRTAALNHLKPPFEDKLLKFLNYKSDYTFKITLIKKINDNSILQDIIYNGYGYQIKEGALEQLSEYTDDFLINLILSHDFISHFKMVCIRKLKNKKKRLNLYNKLTDSSLKYELLKTLNSIQANFCKEILSIETDINVRQTAIAKTEFDDEFSIDEFTTLVKNEKNEYSKRTIILNCKSLKLLNAIRLSMDEKYQPLIKTQISKLD